MKKIYYILLLLAAVGCKEVDSTINYRTVTGLPHIYIETMNREDIVTKEEYLYGYVNIVGGTDDNCPDFMGATRVKLRGNSTLKMPKKAYKLKLADDADLISDQKANEEKEWVLLANYIDPTLMLNASAMKVGELLEIKFTNQMIPVDVSINGEYMGNYTLTEQIEIKEARIDLGDDGFLLEIDRNMDEDYQFYSTTTSLPVMIKDANDDIHPEEDIAYLDDIKEDFNTLEKAIMDGADLSDLIDMNSVAKFIITQNLFANEEINNPSSVYIYKESISGDDGDDIYTMGPLWDFDWTCGYEDSISAHFSTSNPLELTVPFFKTLCERADFITEYKAEWAKFRLVEEELFSYMDSYSSLIKSSAELNFALWNIGGVHSEQVALMKTWFRNRISQIDAEIAAL